jgi:zinc transporter ZupT
MHFLSPVLLFLITLTGGSIPLWFKSLTDKGMQLLLAFSGAFLLSITFLHLLPETFEDFGGSTGFYILAGFFLQLFIQRITHGVEHGHVHVHPNPHEHFIPVWSIVLGLSVHAFMEGLPLGFNYRNAATGISLYFAVAAHKLPEAMLLSMLMLHARGKHAALITLFIFSALTPLAGIAATFLGMQYGFISRMVTALIPVVAGAFIHISTTIFFESGTKQHLLTWQKVIAMSVGVAIALITLLLE